MFFDALKPFIWIDYNIAALIGTTMSIGTIRGFSREVIALLLWVSAFGVSLRFTMPLIEENWRFTPKFFAITFISLLILTILIGSLLQHWLLFHVKQTYKHTAFMEHFGGLICGVMQGFVITSIIVFLAGFTQFPHKNWWHESSLLPSFQIFAIWLRDNVAVSMANKSVF